MLLFMYEAASGITGSFVLALFFDRVPLLSSARTRAGLSTTITCGLLFLPMIGIGRCRRGEARVRD